MAQTMRYRYKKPRRLNFVTFLLIAALVGAGYAGARFVPPLLAHNRVKGILAEGVVHYFRVAQKADAAALERALRDDLIARIRAAGVADPDLAVLFERSPRELAVRATYVVIIEHPWINRATVLRFSPEARTSTERPFD